MNTNAAPDDREVRSEVFGAAECSECGKEVELVSETEEWTEAGDGSGRWLHSGFGPAMGICCGHLIVDSWDGCRVYRLPKPRRA